MNIPLAYESNKYKNVTLSLRGQRITVTLHRLNYWVSRDMDPNFDLGKDVSHLCHERACVKWEHLNIETRSVNNKRKSCVQMGFCSGHDPEPDCVF